MTAGAESSRSPRGRRLWLPFAASLGPVLVLVAAGWLLWLNRLPAAEWAITAAARLAGVGTATARVERLELDGLRVTDFHLGDTVAFGALDIAYTPALLAQGRIDTATLTGLSLTATIDAAGVTVHGLEAAFPAGGPAAPGLLPFDELRVEDAGLRLETQAGPIQTLMDLRLLPVSARALEFDLAVEVSHAGGTGRLVGSGVATADAAAAVTLEARLSADGVAGATDIAAAGRLSATISPERQVTGRLSLTDAALTHPRARLAALAGEVRFAIEAGRLIELDAALSYGEARLADRRLQPGRLDLDYDRGALTAAATLASNEGRLDLTLAGSLVDAARPLAFSVAGDLDPAALAAVSPVTATGSINVDVKGEILDLNALNNLENPASWFDAIRAEGEADLRLQDLAADGVVRDATAIGRLRFMVNGAGLNIEAPAGLELTAAAIGERWLAAVPAPVRALLSGPVTARTGLTAPLTLHVAPTTEGFAAAVTGRVTAEGKSLGLVLDGEGRLTFAPTLDLERWEVPFLSLASTPFEFGAVKCRFDVLVTDLAGAPGALAGLVGLTGTVAGRPVPGVGIGRLDVDLEGRVELTKGRLVLSPAAGGGVAVRGVDLRDRIYIEGPALLRFADDPGHIEIDTRDGAVRYRLAFAPSAPEVTLLLPGAIVSRVAARLPRLTAAGTGNAHRLHLDGAALTIDEPPAAANGITADLEWRPEASTLELTVDRLAHLAEPAVIRPLTLRLAASLADGVIEFTARAEAPEGPLSLTAHGRHRIELGEGEADFALGRLEFAPGVVQPADLFPAAAGTLSDAAGAVSMNGRARWDDGGMNTHLELRVEALDLGIAAVRLSGLEGTIVVDGPAPLTTPPGQRLHGALAAGAFDAIPFEVAFHLRPDGRLAVETMSLAVAGGRLLLGDVVFDPAEPTLETTVRVESVDLAELLKLVKVEGLAGRGRLSGAIPLSIEGRSVAIRKGRLEAEGPGRLSYTGSALAGQLTGRDDAVGLTMRALADFHYDRLDVELKKSAAGEGTIFLSMQGANPAVLDGYPFDFNINLEGDFDRLAEIALEGYATLDNIMKWATGGEAPN